MARDVVGELSGGAEIALWHKRPRNYGRPLIHYVRRAQVRIVWAWRAGTWMPGMPRRDAGWPVRLPDSERGRDMAYVYAVANWLCLSQDLLRQSLRRIAPWLSAGELAGIMARARSCTSTGRDMGRLIGLTEGERQECAAWHLQSVDGPPAGERRRRTRQQDGTEGRRRRRAARGAVSRDEYLASMDGCVERTQQWVAAGVSRRTWYRAKASGRLHELQRRQVPNGTGSADSRTTYNKR
jgi:hypothetical protein